MLSGSWGATEEAGRHRSVGSRLHSRDDHRRFLYGDESGFTLVELVITFLIVPLIVGAIAVAFIAVLSLRGGVASRISDAADAQVVSAYLVQDVQSAVGVTTSANAPSSQCGSGTQLLGLRWTPTASPTILQGFQTVVSYVLVQTGSTFSLLRQYCAAGASATPTSTTTVSSDISPTEPAPTIAPASDIPLAAANWISTQGVISVTLPITEPNSQYSYTLVANPVPGSGGSLTSTSVAQPSTDCGFAIPGSGTYASTLCLVDFMPWNSQTPAAGLTCGTGLGMSASITGTPFTMTFCLSVSSTPPGGQNTGLNTGACGDPPSGVGYNGIRAVPIPTYFSAPTSEAFLGNNGFYTGIPGDPALYTCVEGTTSTLSFTNIQVLDANGNPATGWELVTGDAESTDPSESDTWTTCPTIEASCASGPNLNLIPNSSSSPYGNACAGNSTDTNILLTGVGTQEVTCAASVSSDKTGTVMLATLTPTTLTVQLNGSGLQAMFLGVLLP